MERKKILWIVISVGLFLTVMLTVGYVLLSGGKGRGADDPATLALGASPRITNPEDYARPGASLAPAISPSPDPNGDIIVVYGPDPSFSSPAPQATANPAPLGASDPLAAEPTPGWASAKPALRPVATPAPRSAVESQPKAMPKARAKAEATAKPKLVNVTEYWIQAASFKSKGKADEFKASLASSGLSSIIRTKDIDGQTYYQIRIGPYSTTGEANGWLARIRKLADCSDAYVSRVSAKRSI